MQLCHDRFYFDLERQRVQSHEELCASLRNTQHTSLPLDQWVRVTDYQWCLQPLSAQGSLRGIGGRFNIGCELTRARGHEFPALYIANDFDTAIRERYGVTLDEVTGGLSRQEFALRTPGSFTTFFIRGHIDHAFDLGHEENLNDFVNIIKTFSLSKDTTQFCQKLSLSAPPLVRNTSDLLKGLLSAPEVWRRTPQLYAAPAACQIFGQFLRDAGFEAVIYPSQQGGSLCAAVFPENFRASTSRIEAIGTPPKEASCTVLDKDHCG